MSGSDGSAPRPAGRMRSLSAPRAYLAAGLGVSALGAVVDADHGAWLFMVPIVGAVVTGLVALRRRARDGSTVMLAVGAALLVPAYVLWYPARLHWGIDAGTPGLPDVFFIAAYLCFLIGLARRIGARGMADRRVEVIDTLVVSVALGVVVWVVFLSPYLHDDTMTGTARAVAVSYTVIGLFLLGAAVRMLVQGSADAVGDRLLAAWVLVQLLADLVYGVTSLQGTFSLDHPVVHVYPVALTLLGAALLRRPAVRPAAPPEASASGGGLRFALVFPPALIAPAVIMVLGLRQGSEEIPIVALLSGVLFVLVLVRVWLLVVDVEEHRRIRQQLTESIEKERLSARALNDALERAVHRAMHDDLTGLPNRACFYDRTEQALKVARRDGSSTAVLLFDLDRFKEINDTLGHRYGDRVLREIGPRILPQLRESDTLARLGGDEFCVLLPVVDGIEAAIEVADRIAVALEEPIAVDGMALLVAASCGVTVAPGHGDTADLLLQRADVAMYVAKTARSCVVAYEDRLDRNTPDRLALLGELRQAVADEELVLHYQPQIDLRTGAVVGVEALVRWLHPRRGLLAPEEFVPIAEDTGTIHQLTSWVLDAALDQLRRWMAVPEGAVTGDFTMAVNLSPQSLLDESFSSEVAVAVDRSGVAPAQLVLEITETTLTADPSRAQRILRDLAGAGVRFAIDDFGTGYSSLASLKDLPVHELKIDGSFVRSMHDRQDDTMIVRSVIELGHTLGLRTVAEGVEHAETTQRLVDLGCERAQGFAFAPPMTAEDLEAWMARRMRSSRLLTDVN